MYPNSGKCFIGLNYPIQTPKANLHINGTTTYSLTPPKIISTGDLPPLFTSDFGLSSNILMTNLTSGITVDDGTMIHQSENDFYIHNQEANGKIILNTAGNINLTSGNITMTAGGGTLYMNGTSGKIYSGGTLFTINNQVANFNIWGGNASALNLRTSTAVALNVQTNDNVSAIQVYGSGGTPTKNFQVSGAGKVQAREIKVDLAIWPDYVFDVNYSLMPLKDLRIYLDKNKHLPNVPDAKTIETGGVNLGEMSKLSMEKIEELTLYLLQQQDMIETQAKLIKEQTRKIEALEQKLK